MQLFISVYFEKDFFPGPYPKTEEERLKAAKKYGMQPEDYKPWENHDKWGSGDYPEIQPIGEDLKSEYEVWDDKSTKTNFNEPVSFKLSYLYYLLFMKSSFY